MLGPHKWQTKLRIVALTTAISLSIVSLSACSLLPLSLSDDQRAEARMEQIVAAVDSGDPAALEELFSDRAAQNAPDLEAGLAYFLSVFPDDEISWENSGVDASAQTRDGQRTKVLWSSHQVRVDGQGYWLFFADVIMAPDSADIGLYALGASPWDESGGVDAEYNDWLSSFDIDDMNAPGVFVPTRKDP